MACTDRASRCEIPCLLRTWYASGTPVAIRPQCRHRSPSGNSCHLSTSSSSWPYRIPLGDAADKAIRVAGRVGGATYTALPYRASVREHIGSTLRSYASSARGLCSVCWPSLGCWAPMDGCFERTPPSAFWAEMITQSDAPAFTFLLHLPSLNFGRWTCTHPCEAPDPVDGLPILFCQPTPRSASTLDNLTLGAYAWALSAVPYSFVGVTWLTGRCDQALKPRLTMGQQFQNPAQAPFPT
jgi:hypothetical protein